MPKKILCIGLTCLDMIQIVQDYPKEDSDQRSLEARWQRGGNASNNCTVLSQLDVACEFIGTIGQDLTVKFIEEDFASSHIDIRNCQYIPEANSPISTVIINKMNGTRTIIHNPGNLPELSMEHLQKLDFKQYDWVHFEGRNVAVIVNILRQIQSMELEQRPRTSVELEKPRRELDVLMSLADVVFLSREYAEARGWLNAEQAVMQAAHEVKLGTAIVCAWGVQGAGATQTETSQSKIFHSPAFPPAQVVDTLGAGDTFISGMLASLLQGCPLATSLEQACRLAGAKVGQHGLKELADSWKKILQLSK